MKNAKIFLTIFAAVLFTVAMTAAPAWAANLYVDEDATKNGDVVSYTDATKVLIASAGTFTGYDLGDAVEFISGTEDKWATTIAVYTSATQVTLTNTCGTDFTDGTINCVDLDVPGSGDPFRYIQSGIDIASSGDVVNVAAGTYTDYTDIGIGVYHIAIVNKSLTVIGDPTMVNMPILNASADEKRCNGFKISANNVTLKGFKIINSRMTDAVQVAAIDVVSDSNAIENNYISDNDIGIYGSFSSNTIKDNIITNNEDGIIFVSGSSNNNFIGNDISSNDSVGVTVGAHSAIGNNFTYNDICNNDGGIYVDEFTSIVNFNYNNICNNSSYGVEVDPLQAGGISAEYNWWSDASGPGGEGPGSGDIVSTDVDYAPWLDDEIGDFEKVATEDLTSIGPSGGQVKVTITSTPDASNYLDVYQVGSLSGAPVTDETYPGGFDKRSNVVWGIKETGTVTATLVFDYSNQPGVSDASTIEILKRDNAQDNIWDEVTETSRDGAAKTITITGVSSFSEYSLGAGSDNSLPVELSGFTAISEKGAVVLRWTTESEIENLGFIVERRNWKLETGNWEEIASYKSHEELQGQGSVSYKTEYSYTDKKVQPGITYEYRLADISYDGVVEYHGTRKVTVKGSDEVTLPKGFALKSVYPNPFNPETNISYAIGEEAEVNLVIVDLLGREVKQLLNNEVRSQGNYIVKWDGTNDSGFNLSSGVYFVVMKARGTVDMQKMVLFR